MSYPGDGDSDLLAAEGMTEEDKVECQIDLEERTERDAYNLTVASRTRPDGIVVREILRPTSAPKVAELLGEALRLAADEKQETLHLWNAEMMASADWSPFDEDCPETALKKRYDVAAAHEVAVRESCEIYRRGGWVE